MKNGDKPSQPLQAQDPNGDLRAPEHGLTKREYFAALAMQAMISRDVVIPSKIAKDAINFADRLLAELEKYNN